MKATDSKPRWIKWAIKSALIVVAVMIGALMMTYLGSAVFKSQQSVLAFGAVLKDWFWILFALRLAMYATLYWKSQIIFERLIGKDTLQGIDFGSSNYRHMLLRVAVVYEVVFPFDVIGRLSGGGF